MVNEVSVVGLVTSNWSGKLAWLFSRNLPRLSFWAQGVVFYIYLLYCLTGYRDRRELCFYCKYGLYVGGLTLILGLLWVRGGIPWGFIAFMGVLMTMVITYRQAQKDVARDEREAKDLKYF